MNSKDKPEDIFLWSSERVPQMCINIDLNNPKQYQQRFPEVDNLYINISDLIKVLIKKFKFPTINELTVALKTKIGEIFDLAGPQKILFCAIDGTKPSAMIQREKEQFFKFGDYSGKFISINHLLPRSKDILKLEEGVQEIISTKLAELVTQNKSQINAVFSDSSIPGDASLKLNEFIKNIKTQQGYTPNTSHVIVDSSTEGFLNGLTCHELHVYNLNLQTFNSSQNKCIKCGRTGHFYDTCLGAEDSLQSVTFTSPHYQLYDYQEFRKFLQFEFSYLNFNDYCLERVIDDFVLLVILQGQVILPKINFLPLLQGGLDSFIYLYKRSFPQLGYLSDSGIIHQVKLGVFFRELGKVEDILIKNYIREHETNRYRNPKSFENWKLFINELKHNLDLDFKAEEEDELLRIQEEKEIKNLPTLPTEVVEKPQILSTEDAVKQILQKNLEETIQETGKTKDELGVQVGEGNDNNVVQTEPVAPKVIEEEKVKEEEYINLEKIKSQQYSVIDKAFSSFEDIQIDFSKYSERFFEGISFNEIFNTPGMMELSSRKNWENVEENEKKLKLVGEKDFRKNFYNQKFKIESSDYNQHIHNIQEAFVAGISWSLAYFYQGYISWLWCYSYSYAPFFSDIYGQFDKIKKIIFEKGQPLKPLDYQLIMTHPSQVKTLPKCYQHLHSDSEIIDLWPFQYSSDLNWNFSEQVTIIPAFDVDRLLAVSARYESILEDDELRKNRHGKLLLITPTTYLTEPEQFRGTISLEADGINGEIFQHKLNNLPNLKSKIYGFLPPKTGGYTGKLHPDAKSERKLQFDYEQAEILDQILYKNNNTVRYIERALFADIDRAELFNKGLINETQAIQNYNDASNQRPQPVKQQQQVNRGGYPQNNRQVPPRQPAPYKGNGYAQQPYVGGGYSQYGSDPYQRGRYYN